MKQGYLEQEAGRLKEATKKTLFRAVAAYICLIALLYFLMKDSIDLSDPSGRQVVVYAAILTGVMAAAVVVRLLKSRRTGANGGNLVLPYEEDTKEAVSAIIDREASEGKILVEEYIDRFEGGKKPCGERVVLTPSYLLLFSGGTRITAIPRDKIYWICAQVGHKGGSFRVQLLVFTEKKLYRMVGVDIEHVQNIAAQIDRYIPNVFSNYDPFVLSYELEKLFDKNREDFFAFYENERKKAAGRSNSAER